MISCIWLAGGVTALPMGAAHTFEQVFFCSYPFTIESEAQTCIEPKDFIKVLDPELGGEKPFCSVRWSSIQENYPSMDPTETLFAVYQVRKEVYER